MRQPQQLDGSNEKMTFASYRKVAQPNIPEESGANYLPDATYHLKCGCDENTRSGFCFARASKQVHKLPPQKGLFRLLLGYNPPL